MPSRTRARACRAASRSRCSKAWRMWTMQEAIAGGARGQRSSIEGGLLQMLLQARHELDQVAGAVPVVELRLQDLPAVAAGAGRARQREEVSAAGDAAGGAALDRGGADLLVAEPAEQLAEARDLLLIDLLEGLGRHVPAGDAGAAGGDHHVDLGVADPGLELLDDRGLIVLDDAARDHAVAGLGRELRQRRARLVVGFGPGVGDRQDR